MTTVLLVRHGRTGANTAGVLAGRSAGVTLDEVGVKQVATVGQRLVAIPLTAVVSSPLRRCRQTAHAIAEVRDPAPAVALEKGLVECGYGAWTGRKLAELSKEKLWQVVQNQPSAVRFPEGESLTEMSARAVDAVRRWDARIAAEHGPDAVWAAVSHGDVIKAILADALGMHLDAFQRILVDPASVSVITYAPPRSFVRVMNSASTDLAALVPRPEKKRTGRRKAAVVPDAPVGGGLGAAEEP